MKEAKNATVAANLSRKIFL